MHQLTAYGGLKGKVPFQQAILQSGAFLPMPTSQKQEAIYTNFLIAAGVRNLDEARKLSTEKLQFANAILVGQAPYGDFTFSEYLASFGNSPLTELYQIPLSMVISRQLSQGSSCLREAMTTVSR